MLENSLSKIIFESSLKVHKSLGPGLLESAYRKCLAWELRQQGLNIEEEVPVPLTYGDVELEVGYRIDIFVNRTVIIEVKSVELLKPIHMAQLLTYLKLTNKKLGLLINFNTKLLKNGFKRVANNL